MKKIVLFFLLLFSILTFSQVKQKDTIKTEKPPKDTLSVANSESETKILLDIKEANSKAIQPKFSPTKAGLYSAVLPGLGQLYNKKYWKIPIVLGAVGTGVGIVLWNDKQYRRFRNDFIAELNGQIHEFSDKIKYPNYTKETLGNLQDQYKRQRDYAIAITSLVYILNIIDAVVDAHLYEGRHDPDLAISPTVVQDNFGFGNAKAGLSLNYKF